MTVQKIKRGGKSARRVAAASGRGRQVRAAQARTGSLIDGLMAAQPFSERQLHRIFMAMILGALAVLAWMVATFVGVPAMVREQLIALAHNSGFELRKVYVRGTNHLNELKVYQIALSDRNRAMPFVDIMALRARLLELSWVEDARVSRQLPDAVVIDIVERKPVAVLKLPNRLVLIDAGGHKLETVSPERASGELLIGGFDAARQIGALIALLDNAPALRSQLVAAEWIGNRRWNLSFKSGQVLVLPEGGDQAARALVKFAQIDGRNRLLGGKAMTFDMRAADRIYLRVPNRAAEPAAKIAAATPKPANFAEAELPDTPPVAVAKASSRSSSSSNSSSSNSSSSKTGLKSRSGSRPGSQSNSNPSDID